MSACYVTISGWTSWGGQGSKQMWKCWGRLKIKVTLKKCIYHPHVLMFKSNPHYLAGWRVGLNCDTSLDSTMWHCLKTYDLSSVSLLCNTNHSLVLILWRSTSMQCSIKSALCIYRIKGNHKYFVY
jgi:hypothetical protein